MGGAVFSPDPCWLFGLRCPSAGVCRLLGEARSRCQNGDLWETSHWAVFPRACTTRALASTVSHSEPSPPQQSLQDPHVDLAQASVESLLCAGSQCMWNPVCALQGWNLFPSPVALLHSSLAGLQSQVLWGLPLPMPDPQSGEPDVRLRALTPVGELLQYNYFPVCGSPTWWVWDLFILWKCCSYHFVVASSLSLDVKYLFW